MANTVAGHEGLKDKWMLDSGATRHMTHDLAYLTSIHGTDGSSEMGDGSIIRIEKVRTVVSTAVGDEIQRTI